MFYNLYMEIFEKLALLSENMDVEEGETAQTCPTYIHDSSVTIHDQQITYARMPGGNSIPLLKTMVTSVCEKNCLYCAFRSGRDIPRATFRPQELADTFLNLVNKNVAKGLFLSSGVINKGIFSQDKIIETAELLRRRRNFQGYMHLKIMPGAEKEQIRELMMHADRVSINLEAPNPKRLSLLAPKKDFFEELFTRLKWVDEIRHEDVTGRNWKHRWPSISTQFVVGAAGENDIELVKSSAYLFQKFHLARVYYSAFSPVLHTPFEEYPAENPLREHRLYQSSFLLRDYGFHFEELSFNEAGNLFLQADPKTIWAENHLLNSPVEINNASKDQLLRVPGIGPIKAERILKFRRTHNIRSQDDLKVIGISPEKSGHYLLLNGRQVERQLTLFSF